MKSENIEATQDLLVEISDTAWKSMLPFLKALPNVYVGHPETCRRFLSAVVWMTKEGATWRGLPKPMALGIPSIVASGDGAMRVFLKNFINISMLRVKSPHTSLIRRFFGHTLPQRVRRKKNGGQSNQTLGRSHGGFTTKRHAAVSDAVRPLRFILTAGASHDVRQAPTLIARQTFEAVIADTAYDSDALRAEILAQGGIAVIRPQRNRLQERPYDQELYKLRNVIERFFHRLKQFRRVATRYDKYASRYLGFVYFAAILITDKKM